MSVRFITGGIGSGKTDFCFNEIIKRRKDGAEELFYIIPEQSAVQSEKDLIAASPHKGLLEISVLSFKRLAFHTINELGGIDRKILEDQGKAILIRKALYDLRGELGFYAKSADKPGFVSGLAELVSELRKYSVGLDILAAARDGLSSSKSAGAAGLMRKLGDLCLILDKYNEYLSTGFISTDELLDVLADMLERSDTLCNAELWVDGFFGYTLQELKVLEKLFVCAKTVTVTVCDFGPGFDEGMFAELSKNSSRLVELCKKNRVEYDITKHGGVSKRSPDIRFLLDRAFGKPGELPDYADNITLSTYSSQQKELAGLTNGIMRLVRDKGYNFRDIAVLMASGEHYSVRLKAQFKKCGIPLFLDEKSGAGGHQLSEFLRSALEIVTSDRSYNAVFRFLKTGLCGVSIKTVDRLENYALEFGITGRMWDMEWQFGRTVFDAEEGDEPGTDFHLQLMNNTRLYINERLRPLLSMGSGKKHTIKEISKRLYKLMLDCKAPEKLSYSATEFRRRGDNELALKQQQVWGRIVDLLDKLVELLGEQKVDLAEYSRIIGAGLDSVKLATAPATQDAVIAGDFNRSILPKIKALFIVGLNDGVYPSAGAKDSLLSEIDKELLRSEFAVELQSGGIERSYQEMFQFYANLAKPRNKIFISYPVTDAAGKEQRPSILITELKEMLGGVLELKKDWLAGEPGVKAEAFAMLIDGLREGKTDASTVALTMYFENDDGYRGRLEKMKRSLEADTVGSERLSGETIDGVYGGRLKTSVTKLEKYNGCPFSYYAQYVLKAGERKLHEMKSLDIGNYFHAILDSFTEKLIALGKNDYADREALSALAEASVEERLLGFSGAERALFTQTPQSLYFKHRIREFTKASVSALLDHLGKGSFSPAFSELGFFDMPPEDGKLNLRPLAQKLSDGTELMLEGRIDRVDLFERDGEEYVKVIDYKSGGKSFDLLELYYGLSFQLTVYMQIFIKKYSESKGKPGLVHPAAALYFLIKNPVLKEDELKGSIGDSLLREFKMKGIVLRDEEIISGLDRELELGSSAVIPIYYTKPDKGSGEKKYHTSFSHDISREDFGAVLDYSIEKAVRTGEEIMSGDISARPFLYKDRNGCQYCAYKSICKFDPLLHREAYSRLPVMKKDEVLEKINDKTVK